MFAETGDTNVTSEVIAIVHFLCRSERTVNGATWSPFSIIPPVFKRRANCQQHGELQIVKLFKTLERLSIRLSEEAHDRLPLLTSSLNRDCVVDLTHFHIMIVPMNPQEIRFLPVHNRRDQTCEYFVRISNSALRIGLPLLVNVISVLLIQAYRVEIVST